MLLPYALPLPAEIVKCLPQLAELSRLRRVRLKQHPMFSEQVVELELQVLDATLAALPECPLVNAVLLATALENVSEENHAMQFSDEVHLPC